MKIKVLAGFMVLVFAMVGGCCANPNDAAAPKSFSNCIGLAADKVCNAPPEVVSIADMVIAFLKPEIGALVPGSTPFLVLVTAQGIKDTGCAGLKDLQTMIDFIQGVNEKSMVMAKGMKGAPKMIPIQALEDWKAGVK